MSKLNKPPLILFNFSPTGFSYKQGEEEKYSYLIKGATVGFALGVGLTFLLLAHQKSSKVQANRKAR